jgi:hypothetical protein
MDHNDAAVGHEAHAEQNLDALAEFNEIPFDANATAAVAMATLALSHRLAALFDLLDARLPIGKS